MSSQNSGQASQASSSKPNSSFRLPSTSCLQQCAKLSIVQDKPIMMDYWTSSLEKTVIIGIKEGPTKEKLLVKSEEEYTSPIANIYKIENEFIVVTENSIYLVCSDISSKSIST